MNPVKKTQQTYDQIAADYAAARADRTDVAHHLAQFATHVPVGSLVADIGCGPAYDTRALQKLGYRAVGLDYSKGMLTVAKSQPNAPWLLQGDMRHLPFAANQFAGLWLCASLLHIPRANVPTVLTGCHRLLRPNGILLLSVKAGDGERWQPEGYGHQAPRFFTLWQPQQLDAALKTAAFTLVDGWQKTKENVGWLTRICQK